MLASAYSYAAIIVAAVVDPRDRLTDQIQFLIDAATDSPAIREQLDRAWFSDDAGTELPTEWQAPIDLSRKGRADWWPAPPTQPWTG